MIEVSQLRKSYADTGCSRWVNFSIDRGESAVIIGGSGCGKSVLLRHIIGPNSGDVINGESIVELNERQLIKVRRKFCMLLRAQHRSTR